MYSRTIYIPEAVWSYSPKPNYLQPMVDNAQTDYDKEPQIQ